jgi:beta-glucanase (GH16 family)
MHRPLSQACRATGLALALAALALPTLPARAADTAVPPPAPTLVVPAGWQLAWADEFDVDGLPDPHKWAYDTFMNKQGWFNHELEYYASARARNAEVRDGKLLITARREALAKAADWGGQHYTSARLITRGLAEWTYGFFETRAKLPCAPGTWPAIWMLGVKGEWPDNGEIDIMEHIGRAPGRVGSTLHMRAGYGDHGVNGMTTMPDACGTFHRYQMLWTDRHIVFGIDGVDHLTYPRLDTGPGSDPKRAWPFDAPQFFLLNLAVGGDLGGPVDDAALPATLEVDYVRVWQAPPSAVKAPVAKP